MQQNLIRCMLKEYLIILLLELQLVEGEVMGQHIAKIQKNPISSDITERIKSESLISLGNLSL